MKHQRKRPQNHRLELERLEERALPSGTGPFTPAQIQQAYGVNLIQFAANGQTVPGNGAGQTIALLEAGVDPNIVGDLKQFDTSQSQPGLNLSTFGSFSGPVAGSSKPWFQAVNAPAPNQPSSTPTSGKGEIPADIEWAHAVAPLANIIDFQFSGDTNQAAQEAAQIPGVTVVSTSWGWGQEEPHYYSSPVTLANGTVQNVTFLAAAGDNGATFVTGPNGQQELVNANAASIPGDNTNIISVGGTLLTTNNDGSYQSETGWGFSPPFATFGVGSLKGLWNTASSGGFNGSYNVGAGNVNSAVWTIPMSAVDSTIGATSQTQQPFELSATWPSVAGGATDATYQFYDLNTGAQLSPEGSIAVSQAVSSSGVPDGNGSFQELGVFTVGGENNPNNGAPNLNSGDTLEVVLNQGLNANGNVVADTLGVGPGKYVAGAGGVSQYDTYLPSSGTLAFQASVNPSQTNRIYPDVALNSGSNAASAYFIVNSLNNYTGGFYGTSVSSPCWAGLIAIADQGLALKGQQPLTTSQALTALGCIPVSALGRTP